MSERKEPTRQRGDQHWTRRNPGAVPRGPDAAGAKLTGEQIEELRAAWQDGRPKKTALARRFGVSRVTVWRHLRDAGLV